MSHNLRNYSSDYSRHVELFFYVCCSVHHQSILLNNQCDAALSSRIYYSLRDNLAVNNKYDYLKLNHFGYLIK